MVCTDHDLSRCFGNLLGLIIWICIHLRSISFLSVISIISLTLISFYFSEKIGQKVHNSYSVAYGLLVIFISITGNSVCGDIKDRSDHA